MKAIVLASVLLFSIGSLGSPLSAVEEGGPATISVENTTLVRNGFGSRNKMFLSLYEGSLYLQQKNQNAASIIQANETMAFRIKITSKFVSQKKLVAALEEGFRSANGGDVSAIQTEVEQFRNCFAQDVKMDDVFVLQYVPETGVTVFKNNEKQGVVKGLEFKKAMFAIWLGEAPVDEALKAKLIGK